MTTIDNTERELTAWENAERMKRWLECQKQRNTVTRGLGKTRVNLSKQLLAAEIGAFIAMAVCIVELVVR